MDTIEQVAEAVESVAEQVENVADEIGNKFPEGGKLRSALDFIENAAHKTAQAAHFADEIIDKVVFHLTHLNYLLTPTFR